MPFLSGIKRKPGFGLTTENESKGSQEQLFEHSKAKKHQLQALYTFGNEGCLGNDWTSPILNMDHPSESQMNRVFTNGHSNIPAQWPCAAQPLTSSFPDDHSTKLISKTSDPTFSVSLSVEHGNFQTAAQTPHHVLDTYDRPMCPEQQSANHSQFQQHFPENDSSFLLPLQPQAVERCPECAAGKSGHIRHIGRWRLMDSQ